MPQPPSFLDRALANLAAEPGRYKEDFEEANKRSGQQLYGSLKDFIDPHAAGHGFLEAGPVVGAAVNRIVDPLTSPFTTAFGRPIETATGGKVKKETAGAYASMLVPAAGELGLAGAARAGELASTISEGVATRYSSAGKLARDTGIPLKEARAVLKAQVGDALRKHAATAGKDEHLLTDFKGTLNLPHGSNDPQLHRFESAGPVHHPELRYDGSGGTFGAAGTYLDVSGKFTGGEYAPGFTARHLYETEAPFEKAFVLTPRSVGKFKELIGPEAQGEWREDEYDRSLNAGYAGGEKAIEALKAHGYDGLIVHGFDDLHEEPYAGISREPEDWHTPEAGEANQKRKVLARSMGIPDEFQQDQVFHFKPENIKVGKKISSKDIPGLTGLPTKEPRTITPRTREDAFRMLADAQRRDPETMMKYAREELDEHPGGGSWASMLEHAGDLTHRMSEFGGERTGFGETPVREKVTKLLASLKNMVTRDQIMQIDTSEFGHPVTNYVDAHSDLKTYNEMQELGKQIAIDIGNKKFSAATAKLERIKKALDDGTYQAKAGEWHTPANEGVIHQSLSPEPHGVKPPPTVKPPTDPNLLKAIQERMGPEGPVFEWQGEEVRGDDPKFLDKLLARDREYTQQITFPANDPKDVAPLKKASVMIQHGSVSEALKGFPKEQQLKHLDDLSFTIAQMEDKYEINQDIRPMLYHLQDLTDLAHDDISKGRVSTDLTLRRLDKEFKKFARLEPYAAKALGEDWFGEVNATDPVIDPGR